MVFAGASPGRWPFPFPFLPNLPPSNSQRAPTVAEVLRMRYSSRKRNVRRRDHVDHVSVWMSFRMLGFSCDVPVCKRPYPVKHPYPVKLVGDHGSASSRVGRLAGGCNSLSCALNTSTDHDKRGKFHNAQVSYVVSVYWWCLGFTWFMSDPIRRDPCFLNKNRFTRAKMKSMGYSCNRTGLLAKGDNHRFTYLEKNA